MTTDPPYVAPESVRGHVDPLTSGIILNVVVMGPNNTSQNFLGNTKVGGEVAFDVSRDCAGPLPNNQIATCARADLTHLLIDSYGSFAIAGKTVDHLRLLLEKPASLQGVTLGDTSLLTLPPGAIFGVSTDLDAVGRLGNDFINAGPVVLVVDWSKKEVSILASVSDPQNLSTLTFAGSGSLSNQPPRANAGPDQVIECTSPQKTPVSLSGLASSDPDGPGDLASWTWSWVDGSERSRSGTTATIPLGIGVHRVALTVRDKGGASDVDAVNVTVQDTTPPTLTLDAPAPDCLWSPNHKMVLYQLGKELGFQATDVCDDKPAVEIVSVTSNQPSLGPPDVVFGKKGLCLRAERLGNGTDRIYTITVRATDGAGNVITKLVSVHVPHDQAGTLKCPKVDAGRFVDESDPRCTQN